MRSAREEKGYVKPSGNSISVSLIALISTISHMQAISPIKRSFSRFFIIFFSLIVATALCTNQQLSLATENSSPYISITPLIYIAQQQGELFEIAIDIAGVSNLHIVDFELKYNASLLEAVQVVQGSFLPYPPQSIVKIETINSLGLVHVSISAIDSEPGCSGNGTLARIVFKVVWGESDSYSPLHLQNSLLYDDAMTLVVHDSYSGLYFWGEVQFDPPIEGRQLDLYTQKGGIGSDEYGGYFLEEEIVYLYSYVTYNSVPVQQKIVAFQVTSPSNSSFVLSAITNQSGVAMTNFRVPKLLECCGEWTVVSTVDISGITVWDSMRFLVERPVVGGFSESIITPCLLRTPICYVATVSVVALAFAVVTRKVKKEALT